MVVLNTSQAKDDFSPYVPSNYSSSYLFSFRHGFALVEKIGVNLFTDKRRLIFLRRTSNVLQDSHSFSHFLISNWF